MDGLVTGRECVRRRAPLSRGTAEPVAAGATTSRRGAGLKVSVHYSRAAGAAEAQPQQPDGKNGACRCIPRRSHCRTRLPDM